MLSSQLKLKNLIWKLIFLKFMSLFSFKKPLQPKQVMCKQLLKKNQLINPPLVPRNPRSRKSETAVSPFTSFGVGCAC